MKKSNRAPKGGRSQSTKSAPRSAPRSAKSGGPERGKGRRGNNQDSPPAYKKYGTQGDVPGYGQSTRGQSTRGQSTRGQSKWGGSHDNSTARTGVKSERSSGFVREVSSASRGKRGPVDEQAMGLHLYGYHPVVESLAAGGGGIEVLYLDRVGCKAGRLLALREQAESAGLSVQVVDKTKLQGLVGDVVHQGAVARIKPFQYTPLAELLQRFEARKSKHAEGDDTDTKTNTNTKTETEQRPRAGLVVLLDQIQDPRNLGAIIRSAFALGADAVIIQERRACDVTAVSIKAAAGATAHLPVCRVSNIRRAMEKLKEAGFWITGTTPDATQLLHSIDFTTDTALVIGSEGDGMRTGVGEFCDHLVKIPMHGDLGSLNASVAASIALYEVARQRSHFSS